MRPPFVETLIKRCALNDEDGQLLKYHGVERPETLHGFVTAFPSFAGGRFVERREQLIGAVNDILDEPTRAEIYRIQKSPNRFAFGAAVPTERTHLCSSEAPRSPIRESRIKLNTALPWPVRDQRPRGTCVAFGVSACLEFVQYHAGPVGENLSEQFLYWAARTMTDNPDPLDEKIWLRNAAKALREVGICTDAVWPYQAGQSGAAVGPNPDARAIADAATRKVELSRYYNKTCHSEPSCGVAALLVDCLKAGRPAAICLPVLKDASTPDDAPTNWDWDDGQLYGIVADPLPEWIECGGHCVCVTGWEPDPTEPLGGFFIFRNSWGSDWATRAPSTVEPRVPAPGYGRISASHIEARCWELISF